MSQMRPENPQWLELTLANREDKLRLPEIAYTEDVDQAYKNADDSGVAGLMPKLYTK